MLSYAAEQFGGKPVNEILQLSLETMEGMIMEEIYRDRKTFFMKVIEVA